MHLESQVVQIDGMREYASLALACAAALGVGGCDGPGGSSQPIGASECGAGDVFLLGVTGDAASVVCYRGDDSFETFGPELPISPERAESARIRVADDAKRVIVIDEDAVYAGGGAGWWTLYEGEHRADRVQASPGLELVGVAALFPRSETSRTRKPEVYAFEGERLLRADSGDRVSYGPDGSYFVVEHRAGISIHGSDGGSALIRERPGSGISEGPEVVRTFANSVLLRGDGALRYRDHAGDSIEVEGLNGIEGALNAPHHTLGDEIVTLGDGELSRDLPLSPEIDTERVHAAMPDRYALVERPLDLHPELVLVGPDGEERATHTPDVDGFEDDPAWLAARGEALDDEGGLFFYELFLDTPGPAIPARERALDILEVTSDKRLVPRRIWQGKGAVPRYLVVGDGEALARISDGNLYLTSLPQAESEERVSAPYTFITGASPRG